MISQDPHFPQLCMVASLFIRTYLAVYWNIVVERKALALLTGCMENDSYIGSRWTWRQVKIQKICQRINKRLWLIFPSCFPSSAVDMLQFSHLWDFWFSVVGFFCLFGLLFAPFFFSFFLVRLFEAFMRFLSKMLKCEFSLLPSPSCWADGLHFFPLLSTYFPVRWSEVSPWGLRASLFGVWFLPKHTLRVGSSTKSTATVVPS